MSGAQRYARVPAELGRGGWQRNASHTATVGQVQGRGTSQASALDDVAGQLAAMAARAHEAPSFWADDQGALWVAVPDLRDGGSTSYRVSGVSVADGAAASLNSFNKACAADAHASAEGMRRIPQR